MGNHLILGAVIALTTSLLMWLVAFLDVGSEWFLMWQSLRPVPREN
jgi:predicted small integral membrane protein